MLITSWLEHTLLGAAWDSRNSRYVIVRMLWGTHWSEHINWCSLGYIGFPDVSDHDSRCC